MAHGSNCGWMPFLLPMTYMYQREFAGCTSIVVTTESRLLLHNVVVVVVAVAVAAAAAAAAAVKTDKPLLQTSETEMSISRLKR